MHFFIYSNHPKVGSYRYLVYLPEEKEFNNFDPESAYYCHEVLQFFSITPPSADIISKTAVY